jgi:NADH dehydrogenase
MNLFITGANGFVGRSMIRRIGEHASLHAVCIGRSAPRESLPPNVRWCAGDLLDPEGYRAELTGCDVAVHLAALTGRASRRQFFQVNTQGTRALVDASRRAGVSRFLYVSSIAAAFTDTPDYPYAESKRAAESIVQSSGLRTLIVRPTIVLGPGSPLGSKLYTLATAPVLILFGNGRARIQPIHVDDLARILVSLILENRFADETLDIGGPEDVGMEDFLQRVRSAAGRGTGRALHIPVGPLQLGLRAVERISTSLVPFTAGQLTSFTHDGLARPCTPPLDPQVRLRSLEEMIREMSSHG